MNDLVFQSLPVYNGDDLVFGESDTPTTNATCAIDAAFPILTASVQVDESTLVNVNASFPGLTATVEVEESALVNVSAAFPDLTASIQVEESALVNVSAAFPPLTAAVDVVLGRELTISAAFPALTASVYVVPDRDITISAAFPGLTASVEVAKATQISISAAFPDLTASVEVVLGRELTIGAAFPELAASFEGSYDVNVSRPTVGRAATPWRVAAVSKSGMLSSHQVASRLPIGWTDETQPGTLSVGGFEHRLPSVFVPDETRYGAPIQEATHQSANVQDSAQDADRSVRSLDIGHFQDGTQIHSESAQRHQDGDHSKRAMRNVRNQSATHLKGRIYTGRPKSGTRYIFGGTSRFQDGRVPPPGISKIIVPVVPPIKVSADLLFSALWDGSAHLVFGKTSSDSGQTVTLYILPARFYMTVHTLIAHRLPDLVEIPLFDASVASDMGSFCWSLQASGPSSLFSLLQPENNLPVQLRVTLDGIPFVFAVDSLSRSGAFGKTGASISGRSPTALIGEPYWRAGVYSNAEDRTAQQLAIDALVNTGIDLDWGIGEGIGANGGLLDWLVPAGALSHQGSPLSVVQRIAQAAGGYLQSHRSTTTLITRHPYGTRAGDAPGAPWDWYAGAADVELAADAVITDAVSRVDGADINAVYVSGTTQGVLGFVKRAGSAADKLAPMVSDALITEAVAARQRGLAILGAAGNKHTIRLELPVLTGANQPGILDVGQLVQVNAATPWRGRVRAVSVASRWPSMRQSVTVERHLEVA